MAAEPLPHKPGTAATKRTLSPQSKACRHKVHATTTDLTLLPQPCTVATRRELLPRSTRCCPKVRMLALKTRSGQASCDRASRAALSS